MCFGDGCFGSGSNSGVGCLSRSGDEAVEAVADANANCGSGFGGDEGFFELGLGLSVGAGLGCVALVWGLSPAPRPILPKPLEGLRCGVCGGDSDFLVGDCFDLVFSGVGARGSFCCFNLGGVSWRYCNSETRYCL